MLGSLGPADRLLRASDKGMGANLERNLGKRASFEVPIQEFLWVLLPFIIKISSPLVLDLLDRTLRGCACR